ncbi:LysM peptidoglycan-binding domain-containing protein [Patescibacteria group bacterium]|nr:LysM peptidoglycan-binding domain-containing protein [Patescibacteria group bacterium]
MPQKKKPQTLLEKIQANESLTSRALGTVVVVVIGVLLFNYFEGINPEVIAPESEEGQESEKTDVTFTEENGQITPDGLPKTYQVKENDSLWKIAQNNYGSGYNWVDIANANNLAQPNDLEKGQQLTLPKVAVKQPVITQPTVTGESITSTEYTIQKGDSLWTIAVRAYGDGYRWTQIAENNDLVNPNLIHPGNTLNLVR